MVFLQCLFSPTDSSGWWKGRLHGQEGLFPGNYVEKIWLSTHQPACLAAREPRPTRGSLDYSALARTLRPEASSPVGALYMENQHCSTPRLVLVSCGLNCSPSLHFITYPIGFAAVSTSQPPCVYEMNQVLPCEQRAVHGPGLGKFDNQAFPSSLITEAINMSGKSKE